MKKRQGRGDDFGRADDFCGWMFDLEVILDLEFWRPYSVFGAGIVDSAGFSIQGGNTRLDEIKAKVAP